MFSLPIADSSDLFPIEPSKIVALGLNYRDHIAESLSVRVNSLGNDEPPEPVLFVKTPNVLIRSGDPIVIPAFLKAYNFPEPRVDHEAELAFIIADTCKNVAEEDAYRHILGFTCMNDVSQRNLQNGDRSGWWRGKSLDTFGPLGPRIVLTRDIGDPQNLSIECRVNGKVTQKSNSRNMIFSIRRILAFISKNITLVRGDIITTGTPSGVSPLSDGDVVEVEIEKIGILSNPVVVE